MSGISFTRVKTDDLGQYFTQSKRYQLISYFEFILISINSIWDVNLKLILKSNQKAIKNFSVITIKLKLYDIIKVLS